jgi:ATP-dependent Zn protease
MDSKFGAFHYDRGNGIYGNTLREEVDTKVQDIIHGCHVRVKHMIKDNKGLVRKMADVLLERETLLQDEIVALFTEE